jgi:hypothetical protein
VVVKKIKPLTPANQSKISFPSLRLRGRREKVRGADVTKQNRGLKTVFISKSAKFLFFFILLSLVLYAPTLSNFFVADDFPILYRLLTLPFNEVWQTLFVAKFVRPIIILSFFLNHVINSLHPIGYHLVNVIFHGMTGFMVYKLTGAWMRLINSEKLNPERTGIFAALLFIILPVHTEVVIWISGRSDGIATCLGLTAFYSYTCYAQSKQTKHLLISFSLLALALLAKESVIVLPVMFFCHDGLLWLLDKKRFDLRGQTKIWFVLMMILLAYLLLRYLWIGELIGGYGTNSYLAFAPAEMILMSGISLIRILTPPMPFLLDIIFQGNSAFVFIGALIGIMILVVLSIAVRKIYRGRYETPTSLFYLVFFCILLYLVALVPIITILWRGVLFSTESERFLYLP